MKILARIADNPALRISAIYAIVAGAWILLSDRLLQWMQLDAANITDLQSYKGGAFVLITAVLLYRLIAHYRFSSLPPELAAPRSQKLFPLLVFAALGLAIGTSGWYTFSMLRDVIKHDAQQGIGAIGQLRAGQIENWLWQNKASLRYSATDSQMARILEEWMGSGRSAENLEYVRNRFDILKQTYGFNSVAAFDLEGRHRFGSDDANSAEHGIDAQQAITSREPVLVGFHRGTQTGPIALGIMAPLQVDGRIGGAIYAALDPADFLFSLTRNWPGSGKTAEILLVRRDGGQVLFLNKLLQPEIPALSVDVTVADKSLAVAQAIEGKRGVLYGLDYSGKPAVNYIAEIRGSPWLMVARLDELEAYAAINRLGMISSLTVAMLLVMSGLGVWLWWQRQHAYFLAKQDQAALQRQALEMSYDALSKYANDIILITDEAGIIVQANVRALEGYGYTREELIGRDVSELRVDNMRTDFGLELKKIRQGKSDRYETLHQRKDGSTFPVEVSAQWIERENGNFVHFVLRDISERKQAEQRERSRNHVLELLAKNAPLNEILEYMALALEQENPGLLCSILLLDIEGKHLLTGAAPSLPDFYNAAIHGMEIGMGAGSCGTAAFTGERAVVEDVRTHPYCEPYKELADQAKLGACWSEPIKNAAGKVLGTFAVYHKEPYLPTEENIKLIEQEAHLAAIAIEQSHADEELHLASQVYQNSSEAMMVTDVNSNIITVNPAFTKVTGYTPEEVIGKNTRILNSGQHDKTFFQNMWQQLSTTGHWQGEVWNRRKNGEVYPELLTINTIFNADGSPHRFVALFVDITQRKETEELLWRQTNYDMLTGLPNRHMFHDRLGLEIRKSDRSGLPLALLFLDLDRFKEVNDTLGHDMGDILLKEAAQRLSGCVRETDTVARLGGDEFTVILGELDDLGSVERIAQTILHRLSEPFRLGGEAAYVSASIGIIYYPNDAGAVEELLKNADQAMYAAKNMGRNRYHYFTPSMQEAAQTRMRLANDLRSALANQQLILHYQPIVELANGAIHKAETLIRWQHPTRGLINPNDFIPVAEETGLIIDIGNWVLQEAAKQVKNWRVSHHEGFQISVNKSPVQFHYDDTKQEGWLDLLAKLDLQKHSIIVEITEGMLLDANDSVNDKLLAFRDAGMQVSLDDFGTGYSSLSYLKKFHIDYLKIDQSFVHNLENDPDNLALCEAITMMAHKLNMTVIAEGVETAAQRDLLTAIGCDYGQGYLFSRPLPVEEFDKFLKTWKAFDAESEKANWSI